jgi:uncharacterized damage-inducible protein DinB
MDRLQRLRRLMRYDEWANRETLDSVRQSSAPPEQAVRWLGHVLAAERLWLDRLKGAGAKVKVWPALSLEDCGREVPELEQLWGDYLDDLDPGELDVEVEYVNSKGEPWSSTIGDVLNHVLLHSAYHRGQIAAAVRAAGGEPVLTDFIHAARQGLLD